MQAFFKRQDDCFPKRSCARSTQDTLAGVQQDAHRKVGGRGCCSPSRVRGCYNPSRARRLRRVSNGHDGSGGCRQVGREGDVSHQHEHAATIASGNPSILQSSAGTSIWLSTRYSFSNPHQLPSCPAAHARAGGVCHACFHSVNIHQVLSSISDSTRMAGIMAKLQE